MIKRLRLKNWKSHADSEVYFSNGVNALLGIMGSGKSSTMDALSFALFGTFPLLQQRKIKLDEVLRNFPEPAQRARVEVDFILDNETYTVERVFEREKGTTVANLRKEGKLLEGPNAQRVTELVEKLLKTDYDLFARAIYSEQNELDAFLNIPKGQRMERMDRLLHLDRFDTARKTATRVINKLNTEVESREEVITRLFTAEDQKRLNAEQDEHARLKEKAEAFTSKKGEASTLQETAQKELQTLEEKEEQAKEHSAARERIAGQLEAAEAQRKTFPDILLSVEEVTEEKRAIDATIKHIEETRNAREEATNRITSLQATTDVLQVELNTTKEQLAIKGLTGISLAEFEARGADLLAKSSEEENIARDYLKLRETYPNKQDIKLELEHTREEAENSGKNLIVRRAETAYEEHALQDITHTKDCPLCAQELPPEVKARMNYDHAKKMDAWTTEQAVLQEAADTSKKKRDELEKALETFISLEDKLERTVRDKHIQAEHLVELLQKREALQEKITQVTQELEVEKLKVRTLDEKTGDQTKEILQEKIRALDRIAGAHPVETKVQELRAELKRLDEELQKLGATPGALKQARVDVEKYNTMIEKYAAQIEGVRGLVQEKQKVIDALKRQKAEADEQHALLDNMRKSRDQLMLFEAALKKTQESLREEFVQMVNHVMTELWPALYPYNDLSAVKLEIEDRDYVLKVRTTESWMNVEGRVSGGERNLACLVLRIAFALALAPNLSWIVLDEPTHNLDVNAMEVLAETLRERLPKMIDQVFLITHEERLESAVTGHLYRLERNKEVGEPTKVNLIASPDEEISTAL